VADDFEAAAIVARKYAAHDMANRVVAKIARKISDPQGRAMDPGARAALDFRSDQGGMASREGRSHHEVATRIGVPREGFQRPLTTWLCGRQRPIGKGADQR